jgi:hypothetical protein
MREIMKRKNVAVTNKNVNRKLKKKYFLALPLYILYVLIFELYFGYGLSELWSRFKRFSKKGKKVVKRKSKFIKMKLRDI